MALQSSVPATTSVPAVRPVGGRIPRAHAKSASAGTGMLRESTSSHSTESSAAASDMTKYEPKPTAATSASPTLSLPAAARSASSCCSREASRTPTKVTASPTATTVDSLSPVAIPTTTGSVTPVALIGATMLIVPMASAR